MRTKTPLRDLRDVARTRIVEHVVGELDAAVVRTGMQDHRVAAAARQAGVRSSW